MELRKYVGPDGRKPFDEWLDRLRDRRARARILTRLDRVGAGNLGDHKSVGGGVVELREHFGPGYRIYCGRDGESLIILLCGGDKSSQSNDVERAKRLWLDYQEHHHG